MPNWNSLGKVAGGIMSVVGYAIAYAGGPWAPLGYALIIAGGAVAAISAATEDVKKPESPSQGGHRMNVSSSRNPIKLIYGRCEVGVNKTFYHLANPYLHIIAEIGEGVCASIMRQDGTYYSGTATQLPSSNPVLIYFDDKLWTDYDANNVYMEWFDGSSSQNVCATLATASGGKWDQTLRNTCYLYVRLKFDRGKFKKEPNITVIMRGVQVEDPITEQLLTLGSFETDYDLYWLPNYDAPYDVTLDIDTTNERTGNQCARARNNGSGTGYWQNNFAVTAGETVNYEFWSRGDGSVAGRYSIRNNTAGSDIVAITSTGNTSTSYIKVESSFVVPAGCTEAAIRLHDPATAGSAYYDDVAVFVGNGTAWSSNPALCAYDLMTRSSQRGGMGISTSKIDLVSLEASRDYCNAKGWTVGMAITEQRPVSDNLEQILACFRGVVVYSEGKYKIKFMDYNYESYVATYDESEVISGSLQIEMPDTGDRYNAIRVTYLDEDQHWKSNDYTYSNEAAVTADGDYRELSVAIYGLNESAYVQKMAYFLLERNRLLKNVSLLVAEKAKKIEPNDVIRLTHSMPGWTNQLLRVQTANILPDHTVQLSCVTDALTLYDDTFNLMAHDYNTSTLLDPSANPPEVESVTLTETIYAFRLRTQSRLDCSFSVPTDYPWFDHVEVWVSIDAATWKHQFNATEDFSIDPVEESQTYYIKLVTVNIWDTKIPFADAPSYSLFIDGKSDTAPTSLGNASAIVTENGINIYADKIEDNDIELYEFRLGASWSGSVFLAAQRSPELSLTGVRPGNHTFWVNTLGTNGIYGDTPVSVSVVVRDPPDGWAVHSTYGPLSNRIANGDFELGGDWSDYGTPTTNTRSTDISYEGVYSRKFSANATAEGIQSSAAFQLGAGDKYSYSLWVYPTEPSINIRVLGGSASAMSVNTTHAGLTTGAWNWVSGTWTEGVGGSSAKAIACSGDVSTGVWYVDNFIILKGESSNAAAYMYNSDDYVRVTHSGTNYTGEWKGDVYDASSSQRFMAYIQSSFAVIGAGSYWSDLLPTTATLWSDVLNSTKTWAEAFSPEAAPQVRVKLNYGNTTALGSTIERMEILNGIITGRYFQTVVNIIDPQPNIYALVKSPTLKLAT